MKTAGIIPVVVVFLGFVAIGHHFWSKKDHEPPTTVEVMERTNLERNPLPFKIPTATEIQRSKEGKLRRAQTDPDTHFNRERFNLDQDYAQKCRKHQAILSYQNSLRRGDPNYEKVLHMLLKNGYGVEHWSDVCTELLQLHQPLNSRRVNLKQRGYSEAEIEVDLDGFRDKHRHLELVVTGRLIQKIGVIEPNVIADLLSIPIVAGNDEDPFGRGNIRFSEGDPLLTDEDWMTPEHKASQASYQGEPRPQLTRSEKFKQFRDWKSSQRLEPGP